MMIIYVSTKGQVMVNGKKMNNLINWDLGIFRL